MNTATRWVMARGNNRNGTTPKQVLTDHFDALNSPIRPPTINDVFRERSGLWPKLIMDFGVSR